MTLTFASVRLHFDSPRDCRHLRLVSSDTASELNSKKSPEQSEALEVKNSDNPILPEDVAKMRARLSKLHDLHPDSSGTRIKQTLPPRKLRPIIPETDAEYKVDQSCMRDINPGDCNDHNFIQSLRKQTTQNRDVCISLPFGLMRLDSMNKPQSDEETSQDNVQEASQMLNKGYETNIELAMQHTTGNEHHVINETLKTFVKKTTSLHSTQSALSKSGVDSYVANRSDYVGKAAQSPYRSTTSGGKFTSSTGSVEEANAVDSVDSRDSELRRQTKAEYAKNGKKPEPDKNNVFDEQYFGNQITQESKVKDVESGKMGNDGQLLDSLLSQRLHDEHLVKMKAEMPDNLFDQQYFGSATTSNDVVPCGRTISQESYLRPDDGMVSKDSKKSQNKSNKRTDFDVRKEQSHSKNAGGKQKLSGVLSEGQHDIIGQNNVAKGHQLPLITGYGLENDVEDGTVFIEPVTHLELKAQTRPIADIKNPATAYDMAVKLRVEKRHKLATMSTDTTEHKTETKPGTLPPRLTKWSGRTDSKGFRILENQVADLSHFTQDDLVSILKDSVLYEDDKLFVIDKPYGLPSHGGPGVHHSVGRLLEPLASRIDRSGQLRTLHLVHRLDKETTGVMVLAKSLCAAELLLAMFKKRQVIKHYWVLTKGIPNPPQGVIDIPIGEGIVDNKYRMQLKPLHTSEGRESLRPPALGNNCSEAVTNYRVLSSYGSAALVECTPETGVKHQIRCHLAFGLNTPIIGDHKYSHYSRMAPQKLHPEILQLLGVRQAKVRHIPMHLHAKAIVLPEWIDGRNLFLSARLPKHFIQNMKWLKLKPPS